jgi:hypothetical protein
MFIWFLQKIINEKYPRKVRAPVFAKAANSEKVTKVRKQKSENRHQIAARSKR